MTLFRAEAGDDKAGRLLQDQALPVRRRRGARASGPQNTKGRRREQRARDRRIAASLKDGLLTVHIPKRAEFRTRKIKVEVP